MSKDWLVKAGGRILGPYTKDEIEKKIGTREIVALDEISSAFGKWFYIRDTKEFGPSINKLRNIGMAPDELTQSLTDTSTEVIGRADEVGFGQREKLAASIEEGVSSSLPPESNLSKKDSQPYFEVQSEIRPNRTFQVGMVALAISLFFVIYSGIKEKSNSPQDGANDFARLYVKGEEAKKRGDYQRAVQYLKRAKELSPGNWEVVLTLAPLLIIDQEVVLAKRMLNDLVQSGGAGDSFRKRAHNLLALAEMRNFDSAKAEHHLDQSILLDRLFGPAQVNRGIVHLTRKEYDQAEKRFVIAQRTDLVDGAILLNHYLSVSERFVRDQDENSIRNLLRELNSKVSRDFDYQMEMYIAIAHLNTLIENKLDAKTAVTNALRVDPDQTRQHIHDPRVYRENLAPDKVLLWMENFLSDWMNVDGKMDEEIQALHGVLVYRGRDAVNGRQIVEDAVAKNPQSDLVRSVLSWIQLSSGLKAESLANVELVTRRGNEPYAYLVQAKDCLATGNVVCVKDSVESLQRRGAYPLQSTAAEAWLAAQGDDKAKAKSALDSGLKLSENFQPLLVLQDTQEETNNAL